MLGLKGMPRRIYTYPAASGWGTLNLVSTLGAGLLAIGGLLFVCNLVRSVRARRRRRRRIRGAATRSSGARRRRRRSTTSSTRRWSKGRTRCGTVRADAPVVTGLRTDCREVLITDVVDATPNNRYEFPEPSIWPFLAAVATSAMFVGSIFTAVGDPDRHRADRHCADRLVLAEAEGGGGMRQQAVAGASVDRRQRAAGSGRVRPERADLVGHRRATW